MTTLRYWRTESVPVEVVFECGPAAVSGNGVIFGFRDNGPDGGIEVRCLELPSGSEIWGLSVGFDGDVTINSQFPSNKPDCIVVMLRTESWKLMFTGRDPSVSLGFL